MIDMADFSFRLSTYRVQNKTVVLSAPLQRHENADRISLWWGVTTSALALARHIEASYDVRGKTLLELGSGVGLSGLVAAIKGARVTFSDYVPEALHIARLNAIANGVQQEDAEFKILDWEFPSLRGQFDMIIGSEILYEYFFHSSLSDLILSALREDGVLLLADRHRMVVDRFIGRLIRKGLSCQKHLCLVEDHGFPPQEVTVYILKRERKTTTTP